MQVLHRFKERSERHHNTHETHMQENQAERKRNTNLKNSSFTSIVWVLELIDGTLVYGVHLLQVQTSTEQR